MTQPTTEEYTQEWAYHVRQLNRLQQFLSEEDKATLEELKKGLYKIVATAAEVREHLMEVEA
jgi:hypothetical protein